MPRSSATLFVDLTTAFAERGRIAHGTVRVERELGAALADAGSQDLTFCRFDAATQRFIAMTRTEALAVVRAGGKPESRRNPRAAWRSHYVIQAGRGLERWVRTEIRDRFRTLRRRVADRVAGPDAELFSSGGWLLLPGELQRHNFRTLIALRRRYGLRLAFVFYDLLGTLDTNDPRVNDPDATDLPSSEFMLRHASLVLSISAYSAGELRRHAGERGLAPPPIAVIRLGHQLETGVEAVPSPAPALLPNGFVLTVGDVVPRKNHQLMTALWVSLANERNGRVLPLVIVGRIGRDGAALKAAIANDPTAAKVVRFLSNVDDTALRWLYENCRFTVFPSLCEGYGLPVAESLRAGKVCIASNTTSIPEASQGAALHLDPTDHAGWRAAVTRYLDDDEALARAEAKIQSCFRAVSWQDTAADALAALGRARLDAATP